MMVQAYNFGTPTKYYDLRLQDFKGVDLSSYPSEVSASRSPEAVNVFSSKNGIVEKRPGFKRSLFLQHSDLVGSGEDETIHGFWQYTLEQESIILVSGSTYRTETFKVYIQFCQLGRFLYYRSGSDPDDYSGWSSWVHLTYAGTNGTSLDHVVQVETDRTNLGIHLEPLTVTTRRKNITGGTITINTYRIFFFGDGVDGVILFEKETSATALNIKAYDTWQQAYVPTTHITCDASGGGESFEDVSTLTPKRKVGYLNYYTTFKLPDQAIDSITGVWFHGTSSLAAGQKFLGYVDISYRHADGSWRALAETDDFTVDRTSGEITITATGTSPFSVTGEDNMIVTYCMGTSNYIKPVSWNTDKKKFVTWYSESKVYGNFGLNGRNNYLFCAIKNMDRHINLDIFYSSDLAYSLFGSDQSDIMGYSVYERNMVIHKERYRNEGTMYVRNADTDAEGELVFPVKPGVTEIDAVSKKTFTMFKDEPMFLTRDGVYAVTSTSVTNVQIMQNRSYYVDRKLILEPDLDQAKAVAHDGYWYLFLPNGHVYVADSRKRSYAQDAKTESFQYDWYYWEGITASNVFVMNNRIYFTKANRVFTFRDINDQNLYNDVDDDNVLVPVVSYWTTPVLYFEDITHKKSLKNLWARLATYDRSGIKIYYRIKGEEKLVKDVNIDLFDFNDIDFTRFTFNTDTTPHIVVTNRMERQFMSIQFMFKNDDPEPFGLLEIVARYRINSEYKGG